MTRLKTLAMFVAIALLLAPAAAQAAEALPQLKGAWVAESYNGEAPDEDMKITMTFVDDKTLRMEITAGGETDKEEVKYTATADGKMTIYPEESPEGENAKWKVGDDKKLHITTDEGEVLIFARPAAADSSDEFEEESE